MRLRPVLVVTTFVATLLAGTAVSAIAAPIGTVSAAGATSAYVPMPVSQRLVDTGLTTALPPGGSLSVSVTGEAPLPAPGTVTAAEKAKAVTAIGIASARRAAGE